MPLTSELTSEIKELLTPERLRELNQGWRTQGTGCSDEVLDDLISVLVRDDLHYEDILGYLETQFRRQQHKRQEYYGLYSWLVEVVYQFLYARQVDNDSLLERQLHFYEGIATLAERNCPLWVFSLNHDVSIEAIAARFSIPLHSGFSPNVVTLPRRNAAGIQTGELRAEILTRRELETAAMYFPNPPQRGIYLLKVHGALDVFTFNDGQDLLKLLPPGPGQRGVLQALRAANEELLYPLPGAPGERARATNEIAYADANGVMQFLRKSLLAGAYKFDARGTQFLPQSLLKHFRANLNFVTELVCLGYGFGDLHVNEVLRAWLELSADRRLEIVSPDVRAIPVPFRHLAPQIKIVAKRATEWLDANAGIVRSGTQALRKRAFDHIRSLSRKQREAELAEFIKRDQARILQKVTERIRSGYLPAERSDNPTNNDPQEAARHLAAELGATEEGMLERIIDFFERRTE